MSPAVRCAVTLSDRSSDVLPPQANMAQDKMTHFDRVAALTHSTFNSIMASVPENMAGRKIIAGIVMKRGDGDCGTVVSLGTGECGSVLTAVTACCQWSTVSKRVFLSCSASSLSSLASPSVSSLSLIS